MADSAEVIKHPGQIIAAARRSLVDHGMNPRCWKLAAKMKQETMNLLLEMARSRTGVAESINLIHDSRGQFNCRAVATLQKHLRSSLFQETPADPDPNSLSQHNDRQLLRLFYRAHHANQDDIARYQDLQDSEELEWQKTADRQLYNVEDYSKAMTQQGRTIRSTTWSGLLQQSQRWHRQTQNAFHDARSWQQTTEQQGQRYLAWNSLLESYSCQKLRIMAITSQKDLLEETKTMDNCVFTYAPDCAAGTSRIFSVRRDDRPLATSEIRLEQGQWKEAQTQGRSNSPVENAVILAMRELAKEYTRLHKANRRNPHRAWYLDVATDEPAGDYDRPRS